MIKVEWFYWLSAAVFLAVAALAFADRSNARRYGSGAFWALVGGSFIYSTFVKNKTAPAWILGVAVIAMAVLVATGRLGRGGATGPSRAEQEAGADRFGNRLFIPALTIPVVVVIVAVGLKIHIGAVLVYCVGMALFTVIMGNAFGAFPIMTAAIGYPVLVQHFHGNAPAVFAIGMLAGFCGTLCTPMAANFNIVPAALLEMKDKYGPIKAQLPTAIPLLFCNVVLMYLLAF